MLRCVLGIFFRKDYIRNIDYFGGILVGVGKFGGILLISVFILWVLFSVVYIVFGDIRLEIFGKMYLLDNISEIMFR